MHSSTDNEEVKRLSEALQQAQQRLRAVVDASGLGQGTLEFVLRDDGALELVRSSAMADSLLGVQGEALLGRPPQEVLPCLAGTGIAGAWGDVALHGGVAEFNDVPGAGLRGASAFGFLAFQVAPCRVAVKFSVLGAASPAPSEPDGGRSERLFSVAFNQSPEAIALTRFRDGLIVDVNQEWLWLTGFSREEVLGRTVLDIGHWPDSASRQKAMAPLISQGRLRDHETTLTMKDGTQRLVRLNGSVFEVSGEQHILMYVTDITAECLAQAALQAGELALQQANEKLSEQVELYDITESLAWVGHWTASPDGQWVDWSNGLHRLAGTTPGEALSSAEARGGIHEDDQAAFAAARKRMDGAMIEYRWRHLDGTIHWLRSRMLRHHKSGGVATEFGVVQDITVEHEARRVVQDQLEFIQKITSRVPGVVFQFLLRPDGSACFPYASEAIQEMFGVSPQQARQDAAAVFAVVHPDDQARLRKSIEISARDLTQWDQEYRVRLADGSVRWLLGSSVPQREADGSVVWSGASTDITERKLAEARLLESEERFRSLTALSSDWYWELDRDFRFVRLEGGLIEESDVTVVSRIGKTRWDIGALNMTPADWEAHRAVLEAHQAFYDFELLSIDAQGRKYWMSVSGEPVFDAQGEFRGYRGVGRNVSWRKRGEQKIEQLAFYDVLTGLPNRRLLMERLLHALASSERDHLSGALLFIDLDNFKDLNDTQGHDVGDRLLQLVATRLGSCVREVDTVSRLGGDEFVVILEKLAKTPDEAAAQAEAIGKKILVALNQPYPLGDREHHSTPSIGIALFFNHQQSVDELLKRADLAMYEAKAAGRNTMRFFDPAMQAAVAARTALEADLRQGLQRMELLLYYQPVVDATGVVMGVEALARWRHPQHGIVSPAEFIPLAEKTGLILPLGQWVLETACAQLVSWSAQPATMRLSIAVNVSARQFRQPDFARQILDLLRKTGANPYRLKLELTESLLLTDMEDAIQKMGELRSIGVSFSLDDFGTGYSSLSYLKRLPLEQLKIDQSFVRDVLTDPNDAAIAKTILALGQSLGLTVVAEGVETQGQRDFLLHHGCQVFQGYLFGRPEPVQTLSLVTPLG